MDEQKAIETVEDLIDTAADAASEASETVIPEVAERIEEYRTNPYILGVAVVAAGSIGAYFGYKFAEKKLSTKFDALLEEEIKKTREHYSAYTKTGDYENIEEVAQRLIPSKLTDEELGIDYKTEEVRKSYSGEPKTFVKEELVEDGDGDDVEVETRNIFVDGKPIEDFDYEEEVKNRREDRPYVITEEEFLANDDEFEESTLVYYEGDDILADEDDRVVEDVEKIVGEENLRRFGHGSKDKNIVYVCNRMGGRYYEIARSRGKFSVEVLGFDEEEKPKLRRFRGDDD